MLQSQSAAEGLEGSWESLLLALCWKSEEAGFRVREESNGSINSEGRIDVVPARHKPEGKQITNRGFPLRRPCPHLGWVPPSTNLIRIIPHGSAEARLLVDPIPSQVGN